MKQPSDYEESGLGMQTFSLNSDYCHWLTLADPEPSMLPRVGRMDSLNGRMWRLPPGLEGEEGSELGLGAPRRPRRKR